MQRVCMCEGIACVGLSVCVCGVGDNKKFSAAGV